MKRLIKIAAFAVVSFLSGCLAVRAQVAVSAYVPLNYRCEEAGGKVLVHTNGEVQVVKF